MGPIFEKIQKGINYIAFFSILLFVTYQLVLMNNNRGKTILDLKNEHMGEEFFCAKVTRKFIDKSQSSSRVYELSSGFTLNLANSFFKDLYGKIEVGDSICKNNGNLNLYIYKADTVLIYQLDYNKRLDKN